MVDFGFQIDPLSLVMMMVVTGVGSIIHIYSIGYMYEEYSYYRYFAYLNLFLFSMLVLVMGNNFMVMFIGWEGVGVCSYFLIGYYFEKKSACDAGVKAFVVNRIGDFAFLLGIFGIFKMFGTLDFTEVMTASPTTLIYDGEAATLITLALFIGATGKSAQIPYTPGSRTRWKARPRSALSSMRRPWSPPACIWWFVAVPCLTWPR